jgi:hypothetical protein
MNAVPVILLNKEYSPQLLGEASALDVRNVDADEWDQLVSLCRARDLRLYHLSVRTLDGIQNLQSTKALTLEWANKITSLAPVFQMEWLEKLSIIDLPKLRSIAGLERLQNLDELKLSGNGGSLSSPLRLQTLLPLSGLPRLERLSLEVLRLEDEDIKCIASIKTLRHLAMSNQFEREQFAYLAKHLNAQLEQPIDAYREASAPCKKCGGGMYMFRGRRQPFLCRSCDPARFDKLVAAFEELVNAA